MAQGAGRVIQERYRVDRELGTRGAVSSWLVTDLRAAVPCVLKVLRVADAPAADARLFEAQARILAGLDHPGLPRLVEHFAAGEGAGREHCLVLRYHPGESLQRLVAKGRLLTEAQALALLRRIVPILAYLHGQEPPLVHRGFKAANIIVGPDGRPYLTDLHFAAEGDGWRAWEEEAPAEGAGAYFAAPEAASGAAVPASDICAVGLAMIHAMSGQDPAAVCADGSRQRIREATRAGDAFAAILARMVEPSLERRYPDVHALEADLARLAAGRGPAALPPPAVAAAQPPLTVAVPSPAAGPAMPRRGGSPLRAVALLLALAGVAALLWRFNATQRAGEEGGSLLAPPARVEPYPVPAAPAPAPAPVASAVSAPEPPGAPPTGPAAAPAADPAAAPPVPVPPPAAVAAAAAEPAPAAPAGDPSTVEGRLLFGGQPITGVTKLAPTFWFRNQGTGAAIRPQVEYRDGVFRVRGLPKGRIGMGMRINLEPATPNLYPGDLDGWANVVVGDAPLAPIEIDMRKVIRLTQPVDNGAAIPGWGEPCGAGSIHPGRIVFAWEPLGPGTQYEVTVDRLACARGYERAGRAFGVTTAEPWVNLDLAASAADECYSFRVAARRDDRPVGTFTTHGSAGVGFDYRFTVK